MVSKSTVESIITAAVVKGVQNASTSVDNDLQKKDIPDVVNEVLKKVEPAVAHVTNTEPWYQSRTMIGQIVASAALILGPIIGHQFSPEEQSTITGVIIAAGVIFSFGMSLYSRYFAKKPLGS